MTKTPGLFEEEHKPERISKLGNPLERLEKAIDWSVFRHVLTKHLHVEAAGWCGRPPYDDMMLLKILMLREYFDLSGVQMYHSLFYLQVSLHAIWNRPHKWGRRQHWEWILEVPLTVCLLF